MIKIHVLGNPKGCFTRHYHPFRVFKNQLDQEGITVGFFKSPVQKKITNCDALIVFEASYRNILPIDIKNRSNSVEYLEEFFSQFSKVIWFDDHDSSGNLRNYIFPHIDIYAKSQLLSEKNYYLKENRTGILHRDYIYEKYKIPTPKTHKGKIKEKYINKLRLGWNLGLINWPYFIENNKIRSFLRKNINANYILDYHNLRFIDRKLDISYRANMWETVPTVGWWRKKTKESINHYHNRHKQIRMNGHSRISKKEYLLEMHNAIICPSPFGIGEICYRDFECFISGAVLLKPDMSHLETWPDLFIDDETYIAHKWDFSDFEDKLEEILSHPTRFEDIARNGQKKFREALSDGSGFVKHIINMVK